MLKFDFNLPIIVEIIFEDCDDDDVSLQNARSEQENTKENNKGKQDTVEKCQTKTNSTNSESQIYHEGLNTSMLSLKPIDEIIADMEENDLNNSKNAENDTENHDQDKSDGSEMVLISTDAVNNQESLSVEQPNNHHQPFNTYIEDVLNKLSENIVRIMETFYYYGVKKGNVIDLKNENMFNHIKSYFFELSYTTVQSIILPQEQNERFINTFLDNTVQIANSKFKKWRCHRGHVLPFFKELIAWTKQKREYIKKNERPCPSKQNVILKQQLIKPLAPLNLPLSEIVTNNNTEPPQAQNNLCIFSSGAPGNEISINIDANTFIQINEGQQSVTPEQDVDHNNQAPSCEPAKRKTPVSKPRYVNRIKELLKKNAQYDRPPPPYNQNHSSKNVTSRPQHYTQTNVNNQINVNQTYYNNMGQPHQYHQNVGEPIHSYPTQVHYINTNQASPAGNDNLNSNMYYNNNTNNNVPMVRTEPINK